MGKLKRNRKPGYKYLDLKEFDQIKYMLNDLKAPPGKVAAITGRSSTTIGYINKSINYDEYKAITAIKNTKPNKMGAVGIAGTVGALGSTGPHSVEEKVLWSEVKDYFDKKFDELNTKIDQFAGTANKVADSTKVKKYQPLSWFR